MLKIYGTENCKYCVIAKKYFADNGIYYQEVNVGTDLEARTEMVELSGQMGVPVIRFGDKFVVGFNEEKIKDLLK